MLRLAFVGVDNSHAYAFGGILNGFHPELARKHEAGLEGFLRTEPLGSPAIEGVQVVSIWDETPERAQQVAEVIKVEHIAQDPMGVLQAKVDGVCILNDDLSLHYERARPFVEAGVPTYVDKVLDTDVGKASDLVGLSRQKNVFLFSASSLRYAEEVKNLPQDLGELGEMQLATARGPGELLYYGMHSVELVLGALGMEVAAVRNVGVDQRHVLVLDYSDGKIATVNVLAKASYGFQLTLYGKKSLKSYEINDGFAFYRNLMTQVRDRFLRGELQDDGDIGLKTVAIIDAAQSSLERGGELIELS